MNMSSCQVAVIGAGPYGLAATAHLRAAGLETWTCGQPMEFWQTQMPTGMLLRSPWDASHIADPNNELTLDDYEKAHRIRLSRPVPLQDFIRYGRWFQGRVVPDMDTRRIHRVERTSRGFRLIIAGGESVTARHVVVATGIARFAHRPPVFDSVPATLASHSSDHHDLECFSNKRVMVIGGGQSAIESAALLHEIGADVELVVRRPAVRWLKRSALFHSRFNPLRRLLYHRTDVGPAGLSQLVSRPDWFRRLPLATQQKLAYRSIRPAGAAWLVPRVRDVKITTGRQVVSAKAAANQLCLTLDDGSTRTIDHAVLSTGYRVDVSRCEFLSDEIAASLEQSNGYPKLGFGFESSVPGLHFIGAPAALSFGPLMRFVSGTEYAGRTLTAAITSRDIGQPSQEKAQWLTAVKSQMG